VRAFRFECRKRSDGFADLDALPSIRNFGLNGLVTGPADLILPEDEAWADPVVLGGWWRWPG
jgi:hypothetical protein